MTAVQPTSCSTFAAENKTEPPVPNDRRMLSIALFCVNAPIYAAAKNNMPPTAWPSSSAAKPRCQPKGASSVPVLISAIDTAAPNQISPMPAAEAADEGCCEILPDR